MKTKAMLPALITILLGVSTWASSTNQSPLTLDIAIPRNERGLQLYKDNKHIGLRATGNCFANVDVFSRLQDEKDWQLKNRESFHEPLNDQFRFQMKYENLKEGDDVVVQIFCDIFDADLAVLYRDLNTSDIKVQLKNTSSIIDTLHVSKEQSFFNYRVDLVLRNGKLQKNSDHVYKFSSASEYK